MITRLQDVFESLESRQVRYLVIGGIAAVLYGVPRATLNLDVLIDATLENAERLLDAFLSAGLTVASLATAEELLANEITIFQDRVRIDVQTSTPGLTFEDAWARRETMTYEKRAFPVVSRVDLIAAKRAAGRPVDLEDVRMLQADAGATVGGPEPD